MSGGEGPWRCFHCEEVCQTVEEAEAHFGKFQDCTPACRIGVELFRKMEDELQSWRTESDSASKEFYGLGAAHATALRQAEEQGYERGLADGRALSASPASPDREWLREKVAGAVRDKLVGMGGLVAQFADIITDPVADAILSLFPPLSEGGVHPGGEATADAACVAEATTLVPGEEGQS